MNLPVIECERQLVVHQGDADVPAVLEAPEEDLVRERVTDFLLDHPRERT